MKSYRLLVILLLVPLIFINAQNGTNNISKVPTWAKKAIWYQIFPERFCNGDTTNDPKPKDMEGGWPYFIPEGWHISPWKSDWYQMQPWEKNNGHDFYWNAGLRRYGGDLQGVMNRLDYLQKLGITAIYFNPLFESPSLHKYDASMYRHIDNNFGPNPKKDEEIWSKENPDDPSTWQWTTADKLFLKLIQECHKRGIKIIIDGVFNHVGTQFWAFKDVVKNQQKSKYKDWFVIEKWDNPSTPQNEFEYHGWMGVKDLPEFREDENGIVHGPRELIHEIVKRWMDPNGDGDPSDGIDGWRLDVAEQVNHNFWKEFRKWVKGINPEAYITGEIWWEDWQHNKMMNAAPWLQGDEFDAVMNYRFTRAVKKFVSDQKTQISPQEFVDSIKTLMTQYPVENFYVMMNLMGSHDTERLGTMLMNPDIWYDHLGNLNQNPKINVGKPDETAIKKQKLIAGIQFTMPGAPHIYYGDEAGMWGADDPDDRKPMVWYDSTYDDEVLLPNGKFRSADKVKFDQKLFDWYQKLISIRKENECLSLGDIKFYVIDNDKSILGYSRNYKGKSAFILINNNPEENTIKLKAGEYIPSKSLLRDLITNKEYKAKNGNFLISLKRYEILILM
ncbi:glycoside hydrolase family 13 protein [Melioribacteraceae bacterium 4301-Me]|uniref:glycoside hydrolase family 13 protein n=1 Tax=Pyranulibacter aquaticus TaxID=3163344 RepID=UPI003599175C